MIRLKFTMPGQNNSFMKNRVIKDFYIGQDVLIVDNDSYDILICCNKITETPKVKKDKVVGVIMEPSWSNGWDRNLDNNCGTIFVHDNSLFNFKNPECNIVERPSLMFNEFYNSFEYSIDNFINWGRPKSKKISFVVSKNAGSNGNIIYDKRLELVDLIVKNDLPIDIYGRGWQSNGKQIKGICPSDKKINSLIDYEFSIGIENSIEKNYISEKFFDNLLLNTVPIYYGCPNISNIYDENSFIRLDLNDMNKTLQVLENILYLNYDNYLDLIYESKINYIKNHNLITEILKILK